jgi:long-chain acyl-CoA synthetase
LVGRVLEYGQAQAKGDQVTGDAAAERAAIDAEIKGMTICDVLERNVRDHGDKPALSFKEDGEWRPITWREYRERVAELTMGLRALGLGKGDFGAIMARNRPEHLIADLAIVHAGGTPVSFYNTLAPEQISYIAGHCEARVAIVENRDFMERWAKVKAELPALEQVVMIEDGDEFADYEWAISWNEVIEAGRKALAEDRDAFEESRRQVSPDDPVTLIYTSGTTGAPKGVVTTNYNALWTAVSSVRSVEGYPDQAKYVSYLPLAHSAERTATHYVGMWAAAWVHFCPEVLKVFEVVPEVRPYSFVGVPRVWEKIQAAITAGLAAEPNERKRKIAERAIETGREAVRLERAGEPVPLGLRVKRAVFDRLVFSKIRAKLGLDQCEICLTGAAPISEGVHEFFEAIGLPLIEIYGMTESTAPAITNTESERRVGTVGKPMPGVEVKLLDDGELLMRGGNVTVAGYYKEPGKTAETFDADGWLHSGDIAEIDADGFIKIVDRKKEIIITAGGKNIAPSNLEGLLKQHPLVGQACVVGDRKPFISALIVLDPEVAPTWAAKNGIEFSGIEDLAGNERVLAEVQRAVDSANQHVSRVESIKRFVILPIEWTPDSEELTPTLKLKRRVIHKKYAQEIEALYV